MSDTNFFKQLFRSTLLGLTVCAVAVSALAAINPQKASADACSINGRDCYYGYFFNGYDGGSGVRRNNVLTPPAMLNMNNGADMANSFSLMLRDCPGGRLWDQNDQNATGVAFIILTMLGAPPGTPKDDACRRFPEWRNLVFTYEASGLANFNIVHDFGGINTRSSRVDVAYYPQNGAALSIVFYSPTTGLPIYAIKKDCGNPIGRLQALTLNYNLQADIVATVNGAAPVGAAEPGDSIRFTFRVNNTSGMNSPVVNCTARAIDHPGFFPTPGTPEGGGANIPTSCPRSFPRFSNTVVATQTVTAPANTTVCRTLFVTPSDGAGATSSREVCIPVASKPYLKINGGDISAGGDFETASDVCGSNPNASAVSWNKRDAGLYSGAGTQYAAHALSALTDFATAQESPGGGATRGTGLSFANTATNPATGNFGGNFGSVRCIKDHYGQKPSGATTTIPPNVSAMVDKDYFSNSSLAINGGNISSGQNTTLYVNGDLFIRTNITYTGNWSYDKVPLFRVVVKGNIYIGSGVTRLDGTFIAQPTGAAGGYIYTCALDDTPPFSVPAVASGAFFNGCNSKLTVNGSFVSREIEFLRTSGTLRQSNTGDFSSELFNYGPGFWITQPSVTTSKDGEVDNYDSIISLPPVL